MDQLTIDQFRSCLPGDLKKSVNTEIIDHITQTLSDPDMFDVYRENMLGYASVLSKGKFKLENYINAVKYVSFKMSGITNRQAYTATFPDKMLDWAAAGKLDKDIDSYITVYNKSKLVTLIYEQTMIPSHILNHDLYQEALNASAVLMRSAKSEKVRADAAKNIMDATKPPETKKLELDIGVAQNSAIDELRRATEDLAANQRRQIEAGAINAAQVAASPLVATVINPEDGSLLHA